MSRKQNANPPSCAHALISTVCVNNCIFCATALKRKNKIFPTQQQIIEFVQKAAESGIKSMIFSGIGEPTLDPDFGAYIIHAREKGFRDIRLFTNGYGLTLDKAENWKRLGLDSVLLSVHGLRDGHDNNVQRMGAFNDAIRALDIYLQAGLRISINTCLTQYNIHEIPRLLRLLADYPIEFHSLSFPEWAGNAEFYYERLLGYHDVTQKTPHILEYFNHSTYFENIPLCLVGPKTIEMLGRGPAAYLDGKGESIVSSRADKIFTRYCNGETCEFITLCPGFDAKCIMIKGWGNTVEMVRNFIFKKIAPTHSVNVLSPEMSNPGWKNASPRIVVDRSYHKEHITVVLKATDNCNLNCLYCSSKKPGSPKNMTIDLFRKALLELLDYATARSVSRISFLWHGGEPLLLGKDFYRKAFREISSHNHFIFNNLVQTNLIDLDREWQSLFKENDVHVGTSFDPIDGVRVDKSGRSIFERWIDRVGEICDKGIKIGIVFTATSIHLGREKEIYSFFKNIQLLSNEMIGIKINPIYRAGGAASDNGKDLGFEPREFGEFLLRVWNLWQEDGCAFNISPFIEWQNRFRPSCEFAGDCQEHFLCIDGSRRIFSCGRYCDSGWALGNISNSPIGKIMTDDRRCRLFLRNEILRNGPCRDCPYWDLCHGGCPYHAELYYGDALKPSFFCQSYKLFFERCFGKAFIRSNQL